MVNLSQRSSLKELLDNEVIPFADIRQNLQELNIINTYLGGHSITIKGLREITGATTKIISICEIGCGGGDNLLALQQWCSSQNIKVSFTGIDIKKECIEFAKTKCRHLNATWITEDYRNVCFENQKPDIIFSSLFCHHFSNNELVTMMQWMKINSSKGFFINDLHRHWLAYYSIKIITRLFSGSYLVKNDAPLSVARGFKKNEWLQVLKKAGIDNYSVKWKWAFRYLVSYKHE
ncbi:MAG: methyltransferase domain-containing protein [Ferruginibacter sp.]